MDNGNIQLTVHKKQCICENAKWSMDNGQGTMNNTKNANISILEMSDVSKMLKQSWNYHVRNMEHKLYNNKMRPAGAMKRVMI